MNLIILGPQGSGKGTQAKMVVDKFGFNYMEMGNILRSIANSDDPKAEEVKKYMNRGELVPDKFVRAVVWDYIDKQGKDKGFVFDGYPRSLVQYKHLEEMLRRFGEKINWVVYLTISEEETIRRLSARRTCEKCGKIWNLVTNPPPSTELCDCGGKLMQREDDKPEAIKIRLDNFKKKTLPILNKAREEGVLLEVDGERPIEVIHKDIIKRLEL